MTRSFLHRFNRMTGVFTVVLLLSVGGSRLLWAETLECTPITALPTTITEQGVYCLTGSLNTASAAGSAIEIETNNVTIDLNGWKLGGLAGGTATSAIGIRAVNHKNITLRNGTVRGFFWGIFLGGLDAQGNVIEGLRLEQNRQVGIYSGGRGDLLQNNQVVDTGGSTTSPPATGIATQGDGVRVLNNDVVGVTSSSNGVAEGIKHTDGSAAVIEGNRVSQVAADAARAYGFYLLDGAYIVAEGNRVSGISSVSDGSYGIGVYGEDVDALVCNNRISGAASFGILYGITATGGYSDNKVFSAATPYSGGTDYGGNSPPATP